MRETGRAQRRHDAQRLKKARRTYWSGALTPVQLGKVLSAPQPKGLCPCCNKPRKRTGERTMQERSAEGLFRNLLRHE